MSRTYRVTKEDDSDSGGAIIAIIAIVGAILAFIIKVLAYVLPVAVVVGIIVLIVRAKKKKEAKQIQDELNTIERHDKEKDNAINDLARWHSLLEQGAITKSEYEAQKERLLRKINN